MDVRRCLTLSFAQRFTGLLIMVPTIMLLARFLTPAETGVFSVALALSNLGHRLRDFGVAEYLVQERELTKGKIRAAFTVTLLAAWMIAAVLYFGAPLAARFYHEAGVQDVLRVLAVTFVLLPFGTPALAILRREMAYGALYIINTSASVTRSIFAINLAVLGFSYMSLVWAALAAEVVNITITGLYRPSATWLLPSLTEWRSVFSFGTKATTRDILEKLGENANDLVVGRMLGFTAAGLFSRGNGLINIFQTKVIGAIRSVMLPSFASSFRNGKTIAPFFLKAMSYVTVVAWPFYLCVAIMADPIIGLAFGSQWTSAAPILRILAIAGIIHAFTYYTTEAFVASGHIGVMVKVDGIIQPVRVTLLVGAAVYSIEAVAAVQIAICGLSATLQYRELRSRLGISFTSIMGATQKSALVMLASALVPSLLAALASTGEITAQWLLLSLAVPGAAIGWLTGIALTQHPIIDDLGEMLTRLEMSRGWRAVLAGQSTRPASDTPL